ncbi:MAG: ABC transporter permease [Candidatus Omnitrophica bacterium]|nr:ABC transporter permease [Candidatus Omnitrophota bacterium]
MFERIYHILVKEFIQIFRDPRMKAIIFVMPMIQVMVFGYAVSTDVTNIPTAVYDLDNTQASRDLIREFTASNYFRVKKYISHDKEQKRLIDESRVNAVLRINRGFARDLNAHRSAQIQLIVDGTDSNTAAVILSYSNRIIEKYSAHILDGRARVILKKSEFPRVNLRSRSWFNENLESRNFYVPGVIALIVMLITLLLTSMAIVREKEIGTMEQLIVSPIKSYELILGKLTPFAIIGLVDVLLVTAVGVLWFKVPIHGNLFLLFISSSLYLFTCLGVGLFISTVAGTQQEAMMTTFFFYFPAVLLSGFMFPIANMPKLIQWVTFLNPLRYFLVILRGLFLKGTGFEILWPQMLALLLMGVGILTLSSMRFRKRLA